LAERGYLGHACDGLRDDAIRGHDPQASGFLRDEHAAIGQKGKTPRPFEIARHRLDLDLSLLGVDRAILAACLQRNPDCSKTRDEEEHAPASRVTPNPACAQGRLCH
jgi:hypothetical protein